MNRQSRINTHYFFAVLIILLSMFLSTAFANEIKIAIVDTGLDKNLVNVKTCGEVDLTDTGMKDTVGHGTVIIDLIEKSLKDIPHCYFLVKWTNGFNGWKLNVVKALEIVAESRASYVNLSLSGNDAIVEEREALKTLLKLGMTIAVSAGNDSQDLSERCNIFPACYRFINNYYVVASVDDNGKLLESSNHSGPVNSEGKGHNKCIGKLCRTGTSMATGEFLGRLIRRENEQKKTD